MRFLPHTDADVQAMLEAIGVGSLEELLADIPADLRERAALQLPPGLPEREVWRRMESLARRNAGAARTVFLGAGAYPHYCPAVVDHVLQRAEFYSSYTPYQPEVSQGTLQATFEFQSLVAMLFDLDVANASMYDGASAAAEAVWMALRLAPQRRRIVLSRALHPHCAQTVRTYLAGFGEVEVAEVPWGEDGRVDLPALERAMGGDTAAAVVGYPNAFGIAEDLAAVRRVASRAGALVITVTPEPLALAVWRPPGSFGADIAVGEGQSFGIPLSYGGPGVGLFATRMQYVRSMPGRLVGQTVDTAGRRAFALTLATREQHIRRERATSNICTNHALMALAVTVYLCAMGRRGLRDVAWKNLRLAHEVAERLCASGKWRRRFGGAFFNEFVLARSDLESVLERARAAGIVPGWPLGRWFPELGDCLLTCVTEVHSGDEVERLVEVLA